MRLIEELNLDKNIKELIREKAIVKSYKKGECILTQGMYKNETAFIESGVVKVYKECGETPLLLYYLSNELNNGIISFTNIFGNTPIEVSLVTQSESIVYWVPNYMIMKFVTLKLAISNIYTVHNSNLMKAFVKVTFLSLRERIMDYLNEQNRFSKGNRVTVSNSVIAQDLNVSREAVSRIMKSLEREGKIYRESRNVVISITNN